SVGFRMLKSNDIDTIASAGNSGALGAGAMQSVHNIPGIIRPCAATTLARENGGYNLLLDIGATTDVKPDVMAQFGLIGSIYAQALLKIEHPRVCLLNIGTEDTKGNLQCQTAFRLMQDNKAYNFIGNLEPRSIFSNEADVFVTDGFVGNILLKQIETFYHLMVKRNYKDSFITNFNYELHGGSPILGVNAPVVLGHGISTPLAIKNMILLSKRMVDTHMTEKLKQAFSQYADNF
ncbi:MAG: phosphate--acyl-ACP acyltransferase, partial [Bacteroidales bacterium]